MRRMIWVLPLLAILMACGAGAWLLRQGIGPKAQEDLSSPRIFAYRDWQSTGVQVFPGDVIHIRAKGTWLYTPGEYHGPEGHHVYPAPDTYPISGGVPGGVLLGRIGEDDRPFLVGKGCTIVADREGTLYFRINDDILSDNEGFVTVELVVERATPAPGSSLIQGSDPPPEVEPEQS